MWKRVFLFMLTTSISTFVLAGSDITVEDGWVMASVPELPGAVPQGRDMAEARSMIKEAVELLLSSYHENAAKAAPANAVRETLSVQPLAAG